MENFYKVGESIYKAHNTISEADCKYVFDYIYQHTNFPIPDNAKVPWEISNDIKKTNTIYYADLPEYDRKLLDIVNEYKTTMAHILSEMYQETVYPHLTTIVLWKPGQKMPRHVDDGLGSETHREMLKMRKQPLIIDQIVN
jgi:hypothetical protein